MQLLALIQQIVVASSRLFLVWSLRKIRRLENQLALEKKAVKYRHGLDVDQSPDEAERRMRSYFGD